MSYFDQVGYHFDQERAIGEGWAIFECIGLSHEQWRIERMDEADIFKDDEEAWSYVINAALMQGSDYHLTALKIIEILNPAEFERIESTAALMGFASVSQHFTRLQKKEAA